MRAGLYALSRRPWSPTRPISSKPRHSSLPFAVNVSLAQRVAVVAASSRRPTRINPHLVRLEIPARFWTLVLSCPEIVRLLTTTACPGRVQNVHHILRTPILIVRPPLPPLMWRQLPSAPLPSLRSVSHQRPLITTRRHEDIRSLSGQCIFEPAECPGSFPVMRTCHVKVRLEVLQLAVPLPPSTANRVIFAKGQFCWCATSEAASPAFPKIGIDEKSTSIAVSLVLDLLRCRITNVPVHCDEACGTGSVDWESKAAFRQAQALCTSLSSWAEAHLTKPRTNTHTCHSICKLCVHWQTLCNKASARSYGYNGAFPFRYFTRCPKSPMYPHPLHRLTLCHFKSLGPCVCP